MSGLFGVVSRDDCMTTLFYGTDYHSHLGTQFGGVALSDGRRIMRKIHDTSRTQFKSCFADELHRLSGTMGIGVISAKEEQPIYMCSHFGPFAVCMDGLIDNAAELADELMAEGVSFSETGADGVNSIELVAKIIARGDDLVAGIDDLFSRIRGSCTLLALAPEGIYAARDRLGYSPLVIGAHENTLAVASESAAFPNLDFRVKKSLLPGEVVQISQDGIASRREGWKEPEQICTFLWIYTGFPASTYENVNVEMVREESGRRLARADDVEADVVAGVPDSGTAHAIGYAMESGIPYRRPLVKYTPGYGRSYTPPSQQIRDLVAKMKLIPIRDVIDGNRIIVCEDSIVRGTQLRNFTIQKLRENGASEVHVRPACPPLMFPCRFNLSTRTTEELAARRAIRALEGRDIDDVSEYVDDTSEKYAKMVAWIGRELGVTTLRFQAVDDMVEAVGLPREKLCLYCWTGECRGCGGT